MKSLREYILEALKPKANELSDSKAKTLSYNYIKQWATGDLSDKSDCADIKKIDDETLKNICSLLSSVLETTDISKISTILVNDVAKAIESKVDKADIDSQYNDIVGVFSKRRLDIMRLAWALSKSNVEIVAQVYIELFRTIASVDKKRLENMMA